MKHWDALYVSLFLHVRLESLYDYLWVTSTELNHPSDIAILLSQCIWRHGLVSWLQFFNFYTFFCENANQTEPKLGAWTPCSFTQVWLTFVYDSLIWHFFLPSVSRRAVKWIDLQFGRWNCNTLDANCSVSLGIEKHIFLWQYVFVNWNMYEPRKFQLVFSTAILFAKTLYQIKIQKKWYRPGFNLLIKLG